MRCDNPLQTLRQKNNQTATNTRRYRNVRKDREWQSHLYRASKKNSTQLFYFLVKNLRN